MARDHVIVFIENPDRTDLERLARFSNLPMQSRWKRRLPSMP